MNTRTHVIIPQEIATEIDTLVGKRGRSQFLTDAATKELVRLRQRVALKNAIGAWTTEEHPELEKGVDAYVREGRQESEVRYREQVAGK